MTVSAKNDIYAGIDIFFNWYIFDAVNVVEREVGAHIKLDNDTHFLG